MAGSKSPTSTCKKVWVRTMKNPALKCAVCKQRSVFKCMRCKKVYYCGKKHQTLHWHKHRELCRTFKSVIQQTGVTKVTNCGPDDFFLNAMKLQCYDELVVKVLQALMKCGVCVIDNYIHDEIARNVLIETEAIHVKLESRKLSDESNLFRSDEVTWVTGEEKVHRRIKILVQSFDNLVMSLNLNKINNTPVTHKSHLQVSCFPQSTFGYKPHVDNPNDNGRVLTCVYHCNKNYNREKDGGVSRFYVNERTKYVDIEPRFNRAVFYWSDNRVLHEVAPCRSNIFSLTSWYMSLLNKTSRAAEFPSVDAALTCTRPVKTRELNSVTSSQLTTNNDLLSFQKAEQISASCSRFRYKYDELSSPSQMLTSRVMMPV